MDNTILIAIAAVVVVVAAVVWWFFSPSGSASPTLKTKDDIAKQLETQGYKVKEIEFDDGVFEAEAFKDGKEYEIIVDKNGTILKIKEDD